MSPISSRRFRVGRYARSATLRTTLSHPSSTGIDCPENSTPWTAPAPPRWLRRAPAVRTPPPPPLVSWRDREGGGQSVSCGPESRRRRALQSAARTDARLGGRPDRGWMRGGAKQTAHEPAGTFTMKIVRARFPARQAVARPATLELRVRNHGLAHRAQRRHLARLARLQPNTSRNSPRTSAPCGSSNRARRRRQATGRNPGSQHGRRSPDWPTSTRGRSVRSRAARPDVSLAGGRREARCAHGQLPRRGRPGRPRPRSRLRTGLRSAGASNVDVAPRAAEHARQSEHRPRCRPAPLLRFPSGDLAACRKGPRAISPYGDAVRRGWHYDCVGLASREPAHVTPSSGGLDTAHAQDPPAERHRSAVERQRSRTRLARPDTSGQPGLRGERLLTRRPSASGCPSTSTRRCSGRSSTARRWTPRSRTRSHQGMKEWAMERGATHYTPLVPAAHGVDGPRSTTPSMRRSATARRSRSSRARS